MSSGQKKGYSLLDEIGTVWLIYKLRYVLLAILLVIAVLITCVHLKNKSYGYDGFWDPVKCDEWTGEIIRKDRIVGYNNDYKYIINEKGDKIYFSMLKEKIEEYRIQSFPNSHFSESEVEDLDEICNVLFREYLDLDYEIVRDKDYKTLDFFKFRIKGKYADSPYAEFGDGSIVEKLVQQVVKDRYDPNTTDPVSVYQYRQDVGKD